MTVQNLISCMMAGCHGRFGEVTEPVLAVPARLRQRHDGIANSTERPTRKARLELEGTHVVFSGPGGVELARKSVPDADLGPTEVLVRTNVTVISPGTELARLAGAPLTNDDRSATFPRADLGYANIGTVLAAGSALSVRPGDRVYTMARHASIARVDAKKALCLPVPDGLADEDAVFARLISVSMTTLLTTKARGGDSVAVIGLGLIGNLAAQVFAAAGMRVSAVDRSPARRAFATKCGLSNVCGPEDLEGFAQQHRLVVDASGSAHALPTAVRLAATGGEIVMIGAPWGGTDNSVPTGTIMGEVFLRFLSIRSGSEWEIPINPEPLAIGSVQQNAATALEWLADGRINVAPLITHRLPPDAAGEAYRGLRDNPDEYLGVILRWSEAD